MQDNPHLPTIARVIDSLNRDRLESNVREAELYYDLSSNNDSKNPNQQINNFIQARSAQLEFYKFQLNTITNKSVTERNAKRVKRDVPEWGETVNLMFVILRIRALAEFAIADIRSSDPIDQFEKILAELTKADDAIYGLEE